MDKPNHSPAPWSVGYHSNLINDRDGKAVCQFWRRDDKDYTNKNWNVKRIVECVNACDGQDINSVKLATAHRDDVIAWERLMMELVGEDGPGSVRLAIQRLHLERDAYMQELKQLRSAKAQLQDALRSAREFILKQAATADTADAYQAVNQALTQSK